MPPELFDIRLRARRRDRASRHGAELFLHERAFDDCLDRLRLVPRRFRSALLIGCPDDSWPQRLGAFVDSVEVVDPGESFAIAAGGAAIVEDQWTGATDDYDLCLAIGTLDTVNDLPGALGTIRRSLEPDGFFLGAIAGGDSLPQLRSAMRAADEMQGYAVPHVHPRIEASALAGLLSAASFVMPVIDVDRVSVSYESLDKLVRDLRSMAATNILAQRSRRPLGKAAWRAAQAAFESAGTAGRTIETFELLHFAAWTAAGLR
jgi:hypothetical protein